MRLTDTATLPPGSCFLTGTDKGPFFDTGLDIDDLPSYGRIYLAVSTISDFAQQLGYGTPEAFRDGRRRISELEAENEALHIALSAAHTATEALLGAGYEHPPPAVPALVEMEV